MPCVVVDFGVVVLRCLPGGFAWADSGREEKAWIRSLTGETAGPKARQRATAALIGCMEYAVALLRHETRSEPTCFQQIVVALIDAPVVLARWCEDTVCHEKRYSTTKNGQLAVKRGSSEPFQLLTSRKPLMRAISGADPVQFPVVSTPLNVSRVTKCT